MKNDAHVNTHAGLTSQSLKHQARRSTIETRRGLIQNQKRWLHHHFKPHIDTLPLPTGNPALLHRSHRRISNGSKPQSRDDTLHHQHSIALGHAHRQPAIAILRLNSGLRSRQAGTRASLATTAQMLQRSKALAAACCGRNKENRRLTYMIHSSSGGEGARKTS